MKKTFVEPELDVLEIKVEDILNTSGEPSIETPKAPA